jgi:hypothetical protein
MSTMFGSGASEPHAARDDVVLHMVIPGLKSRQRAHRCDPPNRFTQPYG